MQHQLNTNNIQISFACFFFNNDAQDLNMWYNYHNKVQCKTSKWQFFLFEKKREFSSHWTFLTMPPVFFLCHLFASSVFYIKIRKVEGWQWCRSWFHLCVLLTLCQEKETVWRFCHSVQPPAVSNPSLALQSHVWPKTRSHFSGNYCFLWQQRHVHNCIT